MSPSVAARNVKVTCSLRSTTNSVLPDIAGSAVNWTCQIASYSLFMSENNFRNIPKSVSGQAWPASTRLHSVQCWTYGKISSIFQCDMNFNIKANQHVISCDSSMRAVSMYYIIVKTTDINMITWAKMGKPAQNDSLRKYGTNAWTMWYVITKIET